MTGPGALTSALGPDGNPIVYGKSVTGFSNEEEEAVGKTNAVPFLLEDKLKVRTIACLRSVCQSSCYYCASNLGIYCAGAGREVLFGTPVE